MFQELLKRLASALEARQIPYMIIGGQAVLLYGEPRLTKDIDLTLGKDASEAGVLLQMVQSLGWKVLVDDPSQFVSQTMVLPCMDPESGVRFDFIFSHSAYEQAALQRVRRVKLGQTDVCFASLEDVIIHKVVAGRPRDLEDIKGILLKNPSADLAYIRRWLTEFEKSLAQPYVRRFEELRKPG